MSKNLKDLTNTVNHPDQTGLNRPLPWQLENARAERARGPQTDRRLHRETSCGPSPGAERTEYVLCPQRNEIRN